MYYFLKIPSDNTIFKETKEKKVKPIFRGAGLLHPSLGAIWVEGKLKPESLQSVCLHERFMGKTSVISLAWHSCGQRMKSNHGVSWVYTFHGKPIWPFLCISQKFSDFLDRNCEHRETFMLVPATHLVYSVCQMGSLSSGERGRGDTGASVGPRNFPSGGSSFW